MSKSGESPSSDSLTLSVVVPVYNERDSLVQLVDELQAGVRSSVSSYEIIFVDDHSTDHGANIIEKELQDINFRIIRMVENGGKKYVYETSRFIIRCIYFMT